MSSMTMCDVCGKQVEDVGKKLAVLDGTAAGSRKFDMHDACYNGFLQWMSACRKKSGQFKSLEEIRAGK